MRVRVFLSALLIVLLAIPMVAATTTAADPGGDKSPPGFQKVKPIKVHGSDKPNGGPATGIVPRGSRQNTVGPVAGGSDPIAQLSAERAPGLITLSAPIVNSNGMGGAFPNDTVGDVGPNHYVQAINASFQVFDKDADNNGQLASLAGPSQISTLWTTAVPAYTGPCSQNRGDPVVLYDNLADRWLIAGFAPRASGNFICVAISATPDPRPSQGYFLYQFQFANFPDYFKIGAWTDGYYVSANNGAATVAVFDRANMLAGNPAGGIIDFATVADPGTGFNVLMPGDIDGQTPPPGGANNWYYRQVDGAFGGVDRVELYEADVNWVTNTATLAAAVNIPLTAFDSNLCGFLSFGCAPQPGGTGVLLDPVNEPPMFRFPYRNYGSREVLAGNFTVDVNGADGHGIRWFVLERTGGGAWALANEGTYAPQPPGAPAFVHRLMGSLAMDRNGNLAIGYTATSAQNVFPSARYAGRTASDPAGLLPATERTLAAGTASLVTTFNPGPPASGGTGPEDTRWGDYFALTVDPVDDCTFWYTGDYVTGTTFRQSAIGSFRFSDCATDLAITKTVTPAHPVAGQEIVYTITVTNNGPVDAQNVVVTDVLPAQVNYLANTDSCTGVAVGATGTLTCPLGTIAAGSQRIIEIKVSIDPDLGGPTSITNTATVASSSGETDTSNNSVSLTHLVNELADVRVTKFCKPDTEPAPAGSSGVCTMFVSNDGPSAARAVKLVDVHVSDGAFTLGPAVASQGTCSLTAPDTLECNLLTIQPGQTVQVDVDVTSNDDVDVDDIARVSSATPDPATANNEATAGLSFDASADLSITKTGPSTATAGTQFTYTLTVDNAGPSTADNVVVSDELPANVDFVSASTTTGTFTAVAGTVTWNLGNVAPADPARTLAITVFVHPDATSPLVNNASVTSTTSDPNASNNLATWTVTLNAVAGLTLTKTDSPDPVLAGNNLTYTVTVGNAGPSTAQDVVVTDALPSGTTFVSAVGGTGSTACAEVALGLVSCEVGDLDPGESETLFITVKVGASVPDGTVLTNTAVASSPTDPDGAQATATTTVRAQAELWMEKTGTALAGNPAPAIVYRLIVHNHAGSAPDDTPTSGAGGPSDAQNVVVTDNLPLTNKKMTVQFLSPSCVYDKPLHRVTCSTATLPAGTSVVYEIQVQIQGSVGPIVNTATVTSSTPDPFASNNSDTVTNVIKGGTGKGK